MIKIEQGAVLSARMVRLFSIVLIGCVFCSEPSTIRAQGGSSKGSVLEPLNRFPRMVQEYYVGQVRAAEQRGNRRREGITTRDEAEAYVRKTRRKIQEVFGKWPEKTPLNPKIVSVVERDEYRIENIIFESRPGFLVTANLYVPKGREFPLPGVVGTCGHSENGKTQDVYQSFSQGLARLGYVVLIYDPLGQGERLQYPNTELESKIGVGVREHLYAGNQQFLVGEFLGAWRAWDGIRALDYLLTRKEVDPNQIGVTGNSGGGTMTTWLSGVEDRWSMAAPSCFVTTFRRNMENELPADTEQCPPRAIALGLDHADFIAAMAPKPVILLAKEKDFFDVRGGEEAYGRLKKIYGLLGAEKNLRLFIGPTTHGYSQENREAMYKWFNAATDKPDIDSEPELTVEKDEVLWCSPRGQVVSLNSKPIYAFTAEKSRELARSREPIASVKDLKARVVTALRIDKFSVRSVPDYRILPEKRGRRYPKPYAATYAVETEPGIQAIVYRLSGEHLESRPPKSKQRAILYVAHHSSDAELRDEPLVKSLMKAEPESVFYACDLRGVGESQPATTNKSFLDPYGSDFFYAIHGLMLDRPYLGGKTYDLLRVIEWVRAQGHEEIHVVGKGWGTFPVTFAALLSDRVSQVTLKNALSSYAEVAESETYDWPLSVFLPGVLENFDLPDCYEVLEMKKLDLIDLLDANGRFKGESASQAE